MIGRIPLMIAGARWAVSALRRDKRRDRGRDRGRAGGRGNPGPAAYALAGAALGVGCAVGAERRRPSLLRGKVALVTGGSRGLGLLMAREFGAHGCAVVVCARDRAELDRALTDLEDRRIRAHGIQCDLREADQIIAMVREAAERFGRLDIVVNNAGIIQVGPEEALDERHFHDAMETMFWAPLRVSRAALEPLRRARGSIVTITSIGGHLSVPHLLPYSCAKFAETALSEGLGAELARDGIRVTTVVPGLMRTGSHRRAQFTGTPEREYTWFALGAGLPLVSIGGERAARRIVRAVAQGRSYLVLTPLARTAMAVRGVMPSFTQRGLRIMHRVLPAAPEHPEERSGLEAGATRVNRALGAVTVLNERASRRFNQLPDSRRTGRSE